MNAIVIRAPRPDDSGPLAAIMNLPGVRAGTLRMPFETESFARERLTQPGPGVHTLVAETDGVVAGSGTLIRQVGRRSHVGEVFLFVADDRWRRGVGRALLAALLDIADNWIGLARVELTCNADNAGAVALYEAFGFAHEGRRRADVLRNGVLIDSLAMARLRRRPDFEGEPTA
ncbi:MAG: GNAT family N-acetyltransferase [Pikeienuella sp.]|uniref:GNAT family N-acetyltransferase n=1 Tax=Pikeienuella sp. TaxID=2831957 RepID=UPI003919DE0B